MASTRPLPVLAGAYSGLILPSTMTFFHFSYSERVMAAASSGLVPRGSTPILAMAAFISGCCSTLLISPLSFATTAVGMPAGANPEPEVDVEARKPETPRPSARWDQAWLRTALVVASGCTRLSVVNGTAPAILENASCTLPLSTSG